MGMEIKRKILLLRNFCKSKKFEGSQVVRHWILAPRCVGSNPSPRANYKKVSGLYEIYMSNL